MSKLTATHHYQLFAAAGAPSRMPGWPPPPAAAAGAGSTCAPWGPPAGAACSASWRTRPASCAAMSGRTCSPQVGGSGGSWLWCREPMLSTGKLVQQQKLKPLIRYLSSVYLSIYPCFAVQARRWRCSSTLSTLPTALRTTTEQARAAAAACQRLPSENIRLLPMAPHGTVQLALELWPLYFSIAWARLMSACLPACSCAAGAGRGPV